MVLPRPLILAVTGLALTLLAFTVVQRQRNSAEPPAAAERVPATVVVPPADVQRAPAKAKANRGDADRAGSGDKARTRRNRSSAPPTKAPATPAQAEGVPARVARALSQRKVIALLFTLEGAADDSATRSAVQSLQTGGEGKVAVFVDGIGNVGRYSRVVGGLGISQVPSVVIIDAEHQAQLLEGYVDAGTLRQYVADAKR